MDAFADELEQQGFGNKRITLYDIWAKLNHGYKDLHSPYTSPNSEEMFDMLTNENPETFFIVKMVLATVIGIKFNAAVIGIKFSASYINKSCFVLYQNT
jgi:transcription elongation factor SPT6